MKLVTLDVQQLHENKDMVSVGWAVDNNIYYAALVNIVTKECYVEEVGLSNAKVGFTGVFKKIQDDAEWRAAFTFFQKMGVFDKFFKNNQWIRTTDPQKTKEKYFD